MFARHPKQKLLIVLLVIGLMSLAVFVYGSIVHLQSYPRGCIPSDRSRISALILSLPLQTSELPSSRPAFGQVYDIEALESGRHYWKGKAQMPAQLTKRPTGVGSGKHLFLQVSTRRTGKHGLDVYLKLWNLSKKPQPVMPLQPARYPLSFRDQRGVGLDQFNPPPIDPSMLRKSELPKLKPGDCVGAVFQFPSFYTRKPSNIRAKVQCECSMNYVDDTKLTRLQPFSVQSAWISVP